MSGTVTAVCVSRARGTEKKNIGGAEFIADYGIRNDAHAGRWHRQVSLLSYERILAFKREGAQVEDGAFGENLVVKGIDFRALPVGARLRCGNVRLRITQIGKECHAHCAIYERMGRCIMPVEGVFAVVEAGGRISVGDRMEVLPLREREGGTADVSCGSRHGE